MAGNQQKQLADLIDAAPWSVFQRWVLGLISLAIITDGMATQIFGMAIPAIIKQWHVPHAAFAIPTSLGFVGMALGAYGAGLAGDRSGRRWPLVLSVAVFGAMNLLSATASSLTMLGALRFAAGLGLGAALPNATSLVADITPPRNRVFAVSLGVIGMPLGNFLCGLGAAFIVPLAGWRMLFVIGGLVALAIAALLLVFLPESPRILAGRPDQSARLGKLLAKMHIHADIAPVGPSVTSAPAAQVSLLSHSYRRDTLALWAAYVLTMLIIYTVVSWAPTLIAQQGFDLKIVGIGLSTFSAGSILGGLILTVIVPRWGSRIPMAITALLGVAVTITLALIDLNPAHGIALPILALGIMGFMASGVQNMLYALAAHIYPAHMRARGLGTGLAIGRIGAIASGITGAASLSHGSVTFFGFLALVFALLLVAILALKTPIAPRRAVVIV